VTNTMLANPSLTVTAGTGLTGGGSVALGGTTTVSLATNTCAAGSAVTAHHSLAHPSPRSAQTPSMAVRQLMET